MSDDRPRKSWRDIDKARDGSAHRRETPGEGGVGRKRRERGQRGYRAALDRLFDSGKISSLVGSRSDGGELTRDAASLDADDESRLALLAQLKAAEGRDAISEAAEALLAQHAMPRDFDVLAKLLEHRDESRQLEAMQQLLEMTESDKPRRPRAIVGQLKMIRDLSDDDELVELARTLIDRLD